MGYQRPSGARWAAGWLSSIAVSMLVALLSGCGGKVDNRFAAQSYDEYTEPLTNAVIGTPSGVIVAEAVAPDGGIAGSSPVANSPAAAAPLAAATDDADAGIVFSAGTASWHFDDCNPNSHFLAEASGGIAAQRALGDNCVPGIAGQGVLIRTAKDVVQVPDQPEFTVGPRVAVAAWVHPTTVDGNQPIVIKRLNNQTSFSLGVHNGNIEMAVVLTTGKTFISRAPIAAGTWTHVAGMYDGTFVFLFINGQQFGQVYAGGTLRDVFAPIRIGATTQTQFFNGIIDEVFLSTEDISKDVLIALSCISRPTTVAVDPATSGPVSFDTTVHYDIAVSDNDVGLCQPKNYQVFLQFFDPTITTQFDFPPGQSFSANPGTTTHVGLSVTGSENTATGAHPIPFEVFSFGSSFDEVFGQLTYEVVVPSCFVFTRRELMITDPNVVDDPVRTAGLDFSGHCAPGVGSWNFGHLLREAAPTPDAAPAMTQQLFQHWLTDQTLNGFVVPARPAIQQQLLDVWPKTLAGELDLDRAPLRLQAIVNRVDLRDLAAGSAGEGRFVFAVESFPGFPEQFTVILEYNLPAQTQQDVLDWASLWHSLSSHPFPSGDYNAALEDITRRFTSRGASPSRPNGSALVSLRTNEIQLSFQWELREFELAASSGFFEERPVTETPDLSFNGTQTFADFVNQNETAILAEVPGASGHTVSPIFEGLHFQAGSAINNQPRWSAPGIRNPDARFHASLDTCNGCHGPESGTFNFTIITPRFFSSEASLSPFLTGTTVFDFTTGQSRTLNDLARRRADLTSLVCPEDGGAPPPFDGGGLPPPPPPSDVCPPPPPPPPDGGLPPPDGGVSCIDDTCPPPSCDTTQDCLQSHDRTPGSCFQCASDVGCFDPAFMGGTCETVAGFAPGCGVTETQICLRTLNDIFSSHCAAGLQLNPCLCGSTPPDQCLNGTAPPTGPVFPDYVCDNNTSSIGIITNNVLNPRLGVGMANSIVVCAQAFACDCTF